MKKLIFKKKLLSTCFDELLIYIILFVFYIACVRNFRCMKKVYLSAVLAEQNQLKVKSYYY